MDIARHRNKAVPGQQRVTLKNEKKNIVTGQNPQNCTLWTRLKSGYCKKHRNKAVPGQQRVSLKNNGKIQL